MTITVLYKSNDIIIPPALAIYSVAGDVLFLIRFSHVDMQPVTKRHRFMLLHMFKNTYS